MATQKERLQQYAKSKGKTQNYLERLLCMSNGALAKQGDELSDNVIGKIAKVIPELSISWLVNGEGNMLNGSSAAGDGSMQNVSGSHNSVGVPTKKFESEDKWFELVAQKDAQIERMQAQIDKLLSMIR